MQSGDEPSHFWHKENHQTFTKQTDPTSSGAMLKSPVRFLSVNMNHVCLFLQAEPIRVVVTGAAGQIAYSLLYSIAKGDVFGKDQVRPDRTGALIT